MPRGPRFIPPNSLVEVTTRTLHGRFLLPPTKRFAQIEAGIIARAQEKHPVRIHAIGGLSNHRHMLLTVDDGDQLSGFMGYVNGNTAREAGRLVDWRQKLWGRRYQGIL